MTNKSVETWKCMVRQSDANKYPDKLHIYDRDRGLSYRRKRKDLAKKTKEMNRMAVHGNWQEYLLCQIYYFSDEINKKLDKRAAGKFEEVKSA